MAKHSAGGSRFRIAAWIWIVLILIVAGVAVVVAMSALKDRTDYRNKLISGDCSGRVTLTVMADPVTRPQVQSLVDQYVQTRPVVRDTCVDVTVESTNNAQLIHAVETPDGPLPGVWVTSNPSVFTSANLAHTADPESQMVIARQRLGFLVPEGYSGPDPLKDPAAAAYGWDSSVGSTVLAAVWNSLHPEQLANPDAVDSKVVEDAARLIGADSQEALVSAAAKPVAAVDSESRENTSFVAVPGDFTIDFTLVTMNSSKRVGELQARAASDFGKFVKNAIAAQSVEGTSTPVPEAVRAFGVQLSQKASASHPALIIPASE